MNGTIQRPVPYLLAFLSSFCIMILELVASRLVAQHVGASLIVWTAVIGVILAGICLGNVLGGRLADRIPPARAVGPLLAIASALTLASLWVNAAFGIGLGLAGMPWTLRTLVVVTADFLVPATALGMIGPVVAKMAVDASKHAGSAIGDVYMMGAIGSIVGTFVAGFYLIYLAPTSTIVTLVAAGLALLALVMIQGTAARMAAGLAAALLIAAVVTTPGTTPPGLKGITLPGIEVGSTHLNALALAGHAAATLLAMLGLAQIGRHLRRGTATALQADSPPARFEPVLQKAPQRGLGDLAVLAFLISLAFMALEMVAGRLLTRHTGSSIYGWTSVIGVLLGGLSVGNFLGGKLADHIRSELQASWLLLLASILLIWVLLAETPPSWLQELLGVEGEFLGQPLVMVGFPWGVRVLIWTAVVFLVPAITMGTVSPVVAKLAVDRRRASGQTGRAIGAVYAWGMVGSLVGTFLTGFYLIDWLGTKGVILLLSTMLAIAATYLGSVWHALWAGLPLGLCVLAFVPVGFLERQGLAWGVREATTDPRTGMIDTDESQYYYIKIEEEPSEDGTMRQLVLDNLIHGYIIRGQPKRLEYQYEHIYGLVTDRVVRALGGSKDPTAPGNTPLSTLFLGGGSYTFPRYLQAVYPGTTADIAEIDPAVTRANHRSLDLPAPLPPGQTDPRGIHTVWGDARRFVTDRHNGARKYDIIYGDAFNDFSVPWHLTTRQFNDMIHAMLTDNGLYIINIIDLYLSDEQARLQAQRGEPGIPADPEAAVAYAHGLGGFIGAWVETAKLTFPHVYVFGTSDPGEGGRETFVVVAAKSPPDLESLGTRADDPQFAGQPVLYKPYSDDDLKQLAVRSRGIVLDDDYAPVENLLAPVAATRGRTEADISDEFDSLEDD